MKNRIYQPSASKFFSLMTYADFEEISIVLNRHEKQINAAFVICHDRDDCESHYHILLWLNQSRMSHVVQNWFSHCMDSDGNYVNTMIEYTKNCKNAYEYLTHKNDKDKYQYSENDIVIFGNKGVNDYIKNRTVFDVKYSERKKYDDAQRTSTLINDICNNTSVSELIKNYGRDYVINRRAYTSAAACVAMERGDFDNAALLARYANDRNIEEFCNMVNAHVNTEITYNDNQKKMFFDDDDFNVSYYCD